MTDPAKTYRIELRTDPALTPDEGVRALRAFLKEAWRCHRLKCTSAIEIRPEQAPDSPPPTHEDAKP